jgi:hypothetical protein
MKQRNPKNTLNQAIGEINAELLSREEISQTAERVWTNMEQETSRAASARPGRIEGCSDFQALMPDYLTRNLTPGRRALLEDHLKECVPCRTLFWTKEADSRGLGVMKQPAFRPLMKWAIAAALIVAFGVVQYLLVDRYLFTDRTFKAVAEQVDGKLLKVQGSLVKPVAAGEQIELEEVVRTAKGSNAVLRLADGSVVEMRERSELSLDASSKGPMLRLHRGSIIVQAAKQREGRRLAVDASDCRITVKGTVFSVNRSTKGARVSVLEGEVWVEQGKSSQVLKPGQQMSTHASLATIPVEQEIAWSRNLDHHLALVRELVTLGQDLAEGLASAELRYSSRLLSLVPEDTVFYAAFPNVSHSFGQAYDSFRQRIEEDPGLREWWQLQNQPGGGDLTLEEVIARVRILGEYLGQEVVVAVTEEKARPGRVLLLAEVSNQAGLQAALRDTVARINGVGKGQVALFVDNPALLSGENFEEEMFFYSAHGLMVISPSADEIQRVAVTPLTGSSALSTAFGQRLARIYAEGAGWLLAADMERLIGDQNAGEDKRLQDRLGLSDFQQLIVEQKSVGGQLQSRAVLSFSQPRHGMVAWLGEAGPMGALDFVSPDAFAAACFLLKDPALILEDLFEILQSGEGDAWQQLLNFQAEQGMDIRQDIAMPLGSEILFAVDGPILPKPAWKLVVEVDDPVTLQRTIEQLIDRINAEASLTGRAGVMLMPATAAGMNYYKLIPQVGPEITYVFWDGYMVVTPGQGLLAQAIQFYDSGYTLGRSPAFRALFPVESTDDYSGILYQNFMPLVSSLARYVPENGAGLSAEQVDTLRETAARTPATLMTVHGSPNEIVFSGQGLPGLSLLTTAAFGNIGKMIDVSPNALVH